MPEETVQSLVKDFLDGPASASNQMSRREWLKIYPKMARLSLRSYEKKLDRLHAEFTTVASGNGGLQTKNGLLDAFYSQMQGFVEHFKNLHQKYIHLQTEMNVMTKEVMPVLKALENGETPTKKHIVMLEFAGNNDIETSGPDFAMRNLKSIRSTDLSEEERLQLKADFKALSTKIRALFDAPHIGQPEPPKQSETNPLWVDRLKVRQPHTTFGVYEDPSGTDFGRN